MEGEWKVCLVRLSNFCLYCHLHMFMLALAELCCHFFQLRLIQWKQVFD